MKTFDMGRVPPVTFGAGRMAELPKIAKELGGGPVLIVADAFLAEIGVTDRLTKAFSAAGIECDVAADITGEPKEPLVDQLCDKARKVGAKTVVGIGGGAAMDAAKLVATIAPSQTPAHTYALSAVPLPKNGLPAIAVPTTAGTGSEVTRTSIVSTKAGAKNWYWGEELMFAHAVLDPELTISLPSNLTAWTGMDAVAHALEASTAQSTNAAGLLYGREALQILAEALPRVVSDGENLAERGRVLWASMLAGLALHNCNTHMGHNISHSLGSLSRIHHGLATGLALEVTLPWLVKRPYGEDNYAAASQALGGHAGADALPDAFIGLMRACRIPAELPNVCAEVSVQALSEAMKSPANHSMSQNAACPVSNHDLDEMASLVMTLPLAQGVA
ncbi:MAG: iron-containing alcohol dehydrogenase [Pseudomonadota bacterium]